ncbi:hypothetical protein EHI46_00255 [Rhizobium leguminosarum]|jgi:hypothetical protein|uniref:hypothetical protein n=1 Tax=Rhizobium leguminosarum TaxID=384 RepID=UPI000FEFD6AC|nr:hypothetical protein [Rhizobium leguminosarum]RWY79159.1 hypothetical protein EHI46_00255 [Rhizobium leguminosarum]
MKLLRFGEADGNSSLRTIGSRLRAHKDLASDLRLLLQERSIPQLDPDIVTLVEDWTIEKYVCPILVGRFRDPRKPVGPPANCFDFSTPLELISVEGKAARSLTQWYCLGEPSPLADDAVRTWSFTNDR